jgi:hypothetical protein
MRFPPRSNIEATSGYKELLTFKTLIKEARDISMKPSRKKRKM